MPTSPALSDLINPEYLAEQKRLHADPRGYGGRGSKWADVVATLIEEIDKPFADADPPCMPLKVLDYGAGQATLGPAVGAELRARRGGASRLIAHWTDYDPATAPTWPTGPFDLVVCTDVLEHIEPEKIEAVLDHLRSLVGDGQLFTVISLVPTEKKLSDGRQAHILLHDRMWWQERMLDHRLMWDGETYPNPKPEKQFVATWRPL